ncbi:MAG: pilus assembly protein TadG-related protein, partial [Pseudomonadota bacterium]
MRARVRSLWVQNTSGNVAIFFALALVPLLLIVALSIDSSRQLTAGRHLQSAIDAASLAGARAMEDASKTDAEIEAIAKSSFLANLDTTHDDVNCADATVMVNRGAGTVQVTSDCTI